MRCTSLRTVGFYADGKTICWSPKKYSKQFATFQLPCGKCLSCRLESARQTAVRCVHEAQMYDENCFITLTYADEHLKSPKLDYSDFQNFMKKLRTKRFDTLLERLFPHGNQEYKRTCFRQLPEDSRKKWLDTITTPYLGVGEYGDKGQRPHFHAILFNWRPSDAIHKATNERGDKIYSSHTLDALWGMGFTELGSVTFESAGYCARYAAKKLGHGRDGTHEYEPVSRRSTRHSIGKKFVEKYWQDLFNHGECVIQRSDGTITKCGIPRYYEKWFQKHHPEKWRHYVTEVKSKIARAAREKEEKASQEEKLINQKRSGLKGLQVKRSTARKKILEQKFNELQKRQKL